MHFYSSLRAASLLGLAALALLPVAVQAAPTYAYTLTELGTLPGSPGSLAYGVNNKGQVVGNSYDVSSGASHAFLSAPNGGPLTDLGTLTGGGYSVGYGVNDSGQVVGESSTSSGLNHAFLSGPNGAGLTDIGTLGGDDSYSKAINNSGQVVGASQTNIGHYHAFLYQNGVMTDLGTLPNGDYSYGNGINNSGQVTGYSLANDGTEYAFLSGSNGVGLNDIGMLGGDFSRGANVNDRGQVVGGSETISSIEHAFLSGPNGVGLTDLGTLGGIYTVAYGVNNDGQVVGGSNTSRGFDRAFLYQNGVMIDLNTLINPSLGFTLQDATSISDTGFITGDGINSAGQTEAFLLTPTVLNPVPEASTTVSLGVLLTLGLGGVMWKARRKKAA